MQVEVRSDPTGKVSADALVVPTPTQAPTTTAWEALEQATAGALSEVLARRTFAGRKDKVFAVALRNAPWHDVVLSGLGPAADADLETFRCAVARGLGSAARRGARRAVVAVEHLGIATLQQRAAAAAETALLAGYRYREFKSDDEDSPELEEVLLPGIQGSADPIEHALRVARATCWARDLINMSPSDKRPPALAQLASSMAADVGLHCEVLDEHDAADLGMGALLAVGRGSTAPPRLVVLEHAPGAVADQPPVLLVGKGVTFDTGGISIKPARSMDEMKADMAGAAAVLGTLRAVAQLELPVRVAAVVPMAENMPGGDSYRPGDLIRSYSGKSIEVLNTDAEGRLILADALAYGRKRFEPECIVDLATLTGACVVALGNDVAGLMSNHDPLARQLLEAGERTAEWVWRLPLFPRYRKLIESRVADIKNTGGRWAGAITAAKFLEEFVEDTPWTHLDIAGPAYGTKDDPYRPRGGRGFGVRLLVHWLQQRVET